MKIDDLAIHNYKSLRSTRIQPGPLTVLVGPNAAGKSNFCDALEFVGQVYRWGLELAVKAHGGYENICYRHSRRSKSPISFTVEASLGDLRRYGRPNRSGAGEVDGTQVGVRHHIEFGTSAQGIQAPFRIMAETVEFFARSGTSQTRMAKIARTGNRLSELNFDPRWRWPPGENRIAKRLLDDARYLDLPATESVFSFVERMGFLYPWVPFPRLTSGLGPIRLFQVSAVQCREPGVPTPNPEIERSGGNLPAVIDELKRSQPKQFQALLATLQRVMPTLSNIEVKPTTEKTLGLLFDEEPFGRPWTSSEVSDGTIRALALLAALFDREVDVVVIEEPENSLHPWAIRQFVDACRSVAPQKQVFLTTHSPILIDHLQPSEIWIVQRPDGATRMDQLSALDPDVKLGWEEGKYTLSEYLDTGILPAAVPAFA